MRTIALAILVCGLLTPALRGDEGQDFFEKQVRPILVAKCLECHGETDPEQGLRLTSRAALLQGGKSGPAAVEKDAVNSLLMQAVTQQGKLKMPPENKLREDEIAALRKWVELGLPWPESSAAPGKPKGEMVVTAEDRKHWSFQPLAEAPLPTVANLSWPQTSIDPFILAKLESASLLPAPVADRRTLLRRAFYDLTGLPPTWEEVQAFAGDLAPDAWERIIDRLLASPRYGERWGRHWLDVARFADTKDGVLMYGDDRVRPYAYTYRDYVVRALNEDVPYDRFVQEQLAADQLEPKVEPWRLAAMGFLTLGRMYDNNIHDVIDDQIDTTTRGFLGLTVACARCHDHKYDPIPTADYYSLYGVFASSEAPFELPLVDQPNAIAGGDEFEKQAGPKREELRKLLDDQYALLSEAARQRVGDYLVHIATKEPDPLETAIFFLSLTPDDLRPPIIARWRRYIAQRAHSEDPVFGPWRELMDAAVSSSAAATVLERWKARPDGTGPGELNPLVRAALTKATLTTQADVARAYGDLLRQVYEESKVALDNASPPPDAQARRQLLEIVTSQESPAYFPKSHSWKYMSREPKDMFGGKMQELDKMAVQSPSAPPRAMVLLDSTTPVDPCIFIRGNASQRGKNVPRQFLAIAKTGERKPFATGSGRLELAGAITSLQNPLTSRVLVNRVWMHHFVEPLVSTPSDFGRRSIQPTHPELLDHLAARFMADGWSLKKLHRSILGSATYLQASSVPDEAAQKGHSADPDNRWLWRAHRRRLEFEAMRDTLLAVSGRLTHRTGGRPVDAAGDAQSHFRTIFALVDRQSLPGMFRSFDFPSPDQSVERRSRTMVPQQTLFAINSPFVIEQAKSLAASHGEIVAADLEARIRALFRAAFGREPTPEELASSLEFVSAPPEGGSQLTAWEQLAQVLLSSNELMYLD